MNKNIKVVVFDMDQCIVASHSRGNMTYKKLPGFLKKVTKDFKLIVP